uniref:PKS_ER domain-containing protein n=1 Tax=Panagrellus redivivus TaxID=6233 RepID=A0A7E4VY45_PANRE
MASSAIITLDASCEAKLYTRTHESTVSRTASSFEEAACALKKAVPADQVSGVFILPHTDDNVDDEYNQKQMTRVLRAAGYTGIRVFDSLPFQYAMALSGSKIQCKEGDAVCVESIGTGGADQRLLKIFKKTVNGYEFVRTLSSPAQLRKTYPKLSKVIVDSPIKLPNGPKRRISDDYAPLKVNFVPASVKMRPYLWSLVDGDNFGGNLVSMDVRCEFQITFGECLIFAPARMDVVPWTNSINLDNEDADRIDVTITYKGKTKRFHFNGQERFVKLSLFLDDTCHPSAEVDVVNDDQMDGCEDPVGCNQM